MTNLQLGVVLQHLRRLAKPKHEDEVPDGQLLERFARLREESAFAALLGRHGPMVLGVCRGILRQQADVEDAFQATFLILAQKAASIRQRQSVGGWLYEVAYHVALKARSNAVRRQRHERRRSDIVEADPLGDMTVRELRVALHEELRQLPEKYRTPLVLCYLEGKSQEEAARQLGWPKRRIKDRLQRGREQLRRRLSKRGLAPVAALSTALFAADGASATVPAALAEATIRTVWNPAPAAPAVAALVEAGCALLSVSKTKMATMVLLAASLLGGAGLWACLGLAAPPPAAPAQSAVAKASDQPATAPPQREAAKSMEIQGRVLGVDGKPKAGVKLLLLSEEGKITALGTSAADGRFTVVVPREPKYRNLYHYLIAQSDGTGIDFLSLARETPAKPVELRLVKDHAIRGRIVNTEGEPIRGVRVAAAGVNVHINNSLDTFLAAYIKLLAGGKGHATLKVLWRGGGALFAATTDADGRFVLHGIGSERTVTLRLSGAGIADTTVEVVNRAGFDPKPYNKAFRDYFTQANGRPDQRWMLSRLLSGPDVSVVAESEKIIRGVVKDADTGKGQPGLMVQLTGYYDDPMPPFHLNAKTDTEGRYEIHGARKAKSYRVQFLADAATGYTPSQVWADDTAGFQPVPADLKVKKGVIVTGKVIDRETGEAIPGAVGAAALTGNPFVKEYPKFETSSPAPYVAHSEEMEADGTFRLVTIPGPVLLMGGPNHQIPMGGPLGALKYKPPVADPKYPKYFQVGTGATYEMRLTYFGLQGLRRDVDGNFCKVLDIKPGAAIVKQDIVLERASALTVKIQDSEGRPLAGVWVTGISPRTWYRAMRMENDSCPVYHLEEGKPRLMVFCEPGRKLAAMRTLKGDEKSLVVVKLRPMGSVKGRLLDADAKPLSGVIVDLHYREKQAEEVNDRIHEGKQIVTGADGAFTFDELIPELKFEMSFRRGSQGLDRAAKPADATVQIKSGETLDLGDIRTKPKRSLSPGE